MANDGTALVRVMPRRADTFGTAFFSEAYRVAHGTDELTDTDVEVLRASVFAIGMERGYPVESPDGLAHARAATSAMLTLGLSEAAEGDVARAAAFIRSTPLDTFVSFGRSLQEELRAEAERVLAKSVVAMTGSDGTARYGLLDPDVERALRAIASDESRISTREAYLEAKGRIVRARTLLPIAAHFPIALTLSARHYIGRYYAEAFRRPSPAEPSGRGGILRLFTVSYLIRALSSGRADEMPAHNPYNATDFLQANFIARAEDLRRLVGDAFFDTGRVAALVPSAEAAFDRYLAQPLGFADPMGVFQKPTTRRSAARTAALAFARTCLEEFASAVRSYFQRAEDVEVSDVHLNRFWASWILVYTAGVVDQTTLAETSGDLDLPAILDLAPDALERYLAGASRWSDAFRAAVRDRYPWHALMRANMSEESMIRTLDCAATALGSAVVSRAGIVRKPLAFWFRAWVHGGEALRNGILAFAAHEAERRPLKLRGVLHAVAEAGSLGGDPRFLAWAIRHTRRDDPEPYVAHGVGAATWKTVLGSLSPSHDAAGVRVIFALIPPNDRDAVLASLSRDEEHRYRMMLMRPS